MLCRPVFAGARVNVADNDGAEVRDKLTDTGFATAGGRGLELGNEGGEPVFGDVGEGDVSLRLGMIESSHFLPKLGQGSFGQFAVGRLDRASILLACSF